MAAFRWIQALAAVLLIASWAPAPLIAEDPWQTLEAARKGLV